MGGQIWKGNPMTKKKSNTPTQKHPWRRAWHPQAISGREEHRIKREIEKRLAEHYQGGRR